MRYAATAAAIFGAALASLPTTIDPCPAAPTPFPKVTVTEQYQTLSFCVPTTSCSKTGAWGDCTVKYPLESTSVYVSTVIPCAVSGTSASSCTVTTTDQVVPCSVSATTITSVTPFPFTYMQGNATKTGTSYSTSYETTSVDWSAPYNSIGPLAIPGYEGSGLCKNCGADANGDRSQFYSVDECRGVGKGAPVCHSYPYTHVSTKAASATSQASAVCSSKAAVDHPGTYTYTFPQAAPSYVITDHGTVYTVPAQPWFAYATKTAHGPTTFDFTVTITHTITYYKPQPQTPPPAKQTQWQDWGNWKNPATTTTSAKPSSWNNWQTPKPSSTKPWDPPKSTTSSVDYEWGHWTPTATSTTWSVTSTTSTTWSATTTAEGPGPNDEQFYIKVIINPNQRFRKRADIKFIGFAGGDDGVATDGTGAALFWKAPSGDLKTGSKFINNQGSGYIPFEQVSAPGSGTKFSVGGVGSEVTLAGASFCLVDNNLIIKFTSAPSNCIPVSLVGVDSPNDTTSTTTSASATTTTTTTTLTTTTTPATTTPTTTSKPTTTTTTNTLTTTTTTSKPTTTTTTNTLTTTTTTNSKPTTTTSNTLTTTTTRPTTTTTTVKPTTTTTTTTTTSEEPTTTAYPDPSGDLDAPEPKVTRRAAIKRGIRGVRH